MDWNTWWQWKWTRLQFWVNDRQQQLVQLWKGVKVEHKMCPECRALIDKKAPNCPLCGAALTGVPTGGIGRFLSAFFPKAGFYTATILAANLLLYVATVMVSARRSSGDGLNFFGSPDTFTLINFGADLGLLVKQGQLWRWVTAIFLHGGIIHIGFNSVVLYSIGPVMEQIYGRSKFIFIYLVTGVCGYVASGWVLPDTAPTIGASGSIFGLIGVMAVYGHRRGGSYGMGIRRGMIQWAIYSLVFGFFVGANNAAHLGGLISGAGMSFLINERTASEQVPGLWGVMETLSILIILISFAANFATYGAWVK
ncbi:MAG: rhomboid family intramembrane serine protease [Acidobacteria bacterium]|nr:rhomboid family intramembrane serine protease [Acidobacteriota bacterium]MBI3657315.1 rhomboid family intramembrane serine protease [Acidobacteriota bacterium]